GLFQCFVTVGGFPHDFETGLSGQYGGQTGTEHGLIINEQDANRLIGHLQLSLGAVHGTRTTTFQPYGVRGPYSSVPSTARTRSFIPWTPVPVPLASGS